MSIKAAQRKEILPKGLRVAEPSAPVGRPVVYSGVHLEGKSSTYWQDKINSQRNVLSSGQNGADNSGSYTDAHKKRQIEESKEKSHEKAIKASAGIDKELAEEPNQEKRKAILKARVNSKEFVERNNQVEIERLLAASQKEGFVMRMVMELELKRQGILPSKSRYYQ